MKHRLPLLLLGCLLLFGQLASGAMQLCLEEDGNVVVELTLLDCGMVELHGGHESHRQDTCHDDEEPAPCGPDSGVSDYVDLCLDFDFNLNQRQAPSISDCLATALSLHWVPQAASFACHDQGTPLAWAKPDPDGRGSPTHRWLEHEDMLAILHTAQPVVMRC